MIVFIQGPPGSGKSTLGQGLGAELGLPHVSKDDIKEALFDALGVRDAARSRELAVASNRLLVLLVRAHASGSSGLIVESNFSKDEVADVQRVLEGSTQDVCDVFLTAPREVLMERFRHRWESGVRHRGHVDDQRYQQLDRYILDEIAQPLGFGGVQVQVDTDRHDPDAVLSTVLTEIAAALGSGP